MFSMDTYKLIQLLFPHKEHCFCLTDLFMRLLFNLIFFIHFLVIPTESKVQEIKQFSCQVQVNQDLQNVTHTLPNAPDHIAFFKQKFWGDIPGSHSLYVVT